MPSHLPAALTWLIGRANTLTASTLAGVYVQDGPPTANLGGLPKVLVIGGEWQPADIARDGASSTQELSAGNASRNEAMTIACSAFSQSGDSDMAARRAECFGIVGAVEDMIVADRTLGGSSMGDARVSAYDAYRPLQNERGSAAIVDFTITATAFLWDG